MTELHEGKHMNTIRVNTVVLGTGSRNTQTNSRADPEMEKGKEGGGGGGGGGGGSLHDVPAIAQTAHAR